MKKCRHKFEILDCKLYGVPPSFDDGIQRVCIKCGYIDSMFKDGKFLVLDGRPTAGHSKYFDKQIERVNNL